MNRSTRSSKDCHERSCDLKTSIRYNLKFKTISDYFLTTLLVHCFKDQLVTNSASVLETIAIIKETINHSPRNIKVTLSFLIIRKSPIPEVTPLKYKQALQKIHNQMLLAHYFSTFCTMDWLKKIQLESAIVLSFNDLTKKGLQSVMWKIWLFYWIQPQDPDCNT